MTTGTTKILKGLEAVAFAALHHFDEVMVDGQAVPLDEGRVLAYDAPERVTVEAELHPTCWDAVFLRSLDIFTAGTLPMVHFQAAEARKLPSQEEYAFRAVIARYERGLWDDDTKRLEAAGWTRSTPAWEKPEAWLSPLGLGDVRSRLLRAATLKRLPPVPAAAPHEPVEGEVVG